MTLADLQKLLDERANRVVVQQANDDEDIKCCVKASRWFWNVKIFTYEDKAQNHIRGAGNISIEAMFMLRSFLGGYMVVFGISRTANGFSSAYYDMLIALTHWGIMISTLFYLCALISHGLYHAKGYTRTGRLERD